jgi:hypothetical protein
MISFFPGATGNSKEKGIRATACTSLSLRKLVAFYLEMNLGPMQYTIWSEGE